MKYTLKNGTTVEGPYEDIVRIAKALGETIAFEGDGVHYNSASRGLVRITEMDNNHLRNALLKRYREFSANLSLKSNREIVQEIANPSDKTLLALAHEFTVRLSRGLI